jgi:hypothetical protein
MHAEAEAAGGVLRRTHGVLRRTLWWPFGGTPPARMPELVQVPAASSASGPTAQDPGSAACTPPGSPSPIDTARVDAMMEQWAGAGFGDVCFSDLFDEAGEEPRPRQQPVAAAAAAAAAGGTATESGPAAASAAATAARSHQAAPQQPHPAGGSSSAPDSGGATSGRASPPPPAHDVPQQRPPYVVFRFGSQLVSLPTGTHAGGEMSNHGGLAYKVRHSCVRGPGPSGRVGLGRRDQPTNSRTRPCCCVMCCAQIWRSSLVASVRIAGHRTTRARHAPPLLPCKRSTKYAHADLALVARRIRAHRGPQDHARRRPGRAAYRTAVRTVVRAVCRTLISARAARGAAGAARGRRRAGAWVRARARG